MSLINDIKHKCIVLIVSNNSDLAEYADNLFSIKDGKLEKIN
jgi:ABC-type lipoprotein export system ATPase subunit